MAASIRLGALTIPVVRKDIKNLHLSVYPPTGRLRIAAPQGLSLTTVRAFAISKLAWIKRQQRELQAQQREAVPLWIDRESHHVWGKRYLLKIVERDGPPEIDLTPRHLVLRVRPETSALRRQEIVEKWYRDQLRDELPRLLAKWQPKLGVRAGQLFIRRMRTKWGSCNPRTRNIHLNTELAKKPRECLEYVLVHELVHLIEPSHSRRFKSLLDQHLPGWSTHRNLLNRLPVRHEEWGSSM